MELQNQFDPNLRNIISNKNVTALLPIGSIEQHGAHLPVSTDSDIVFSISKILAKKCNFMLLPILKYGCSNEHSPYFNISLKKSTIRSLLLDICTSLYKNKIKKVFILNGHYGNIKKIYRVEKKLRHNKLKISIFSYWDFLAYKMDHGGFVETSLMLAISNKTNMAVASKGLALEDLPTKIKLRYKKILTKSFPRVTKNGIIGDPTHASAVAGRKMINEIIKNFIELVNKNTTKMKF
ncbi:MAG: creatininase family protein [Thaumarchaeota archaeon]|nr:creatininase family protein [Nitrososphaerota archaeon]